MRSGAALLQHLVPPGMNGIMFDTFENFIFGFNVIWRFTNLAQIKNSIPSQSRVTRSIGNKQPIIYFLWVVIIPGHQVNFSATLDKRWKENTIALMGLHWSYVSEWQLYPTEAYLQCCIYCAQNHKSSAYLKHLFPQIDKRLEAIKTTRILVIIITD